jgi:hypothetical protein
LARAPGLGAPTAADELQGGAGFDRAAVDRKDRVRGCEAIE